MAKFELISGVGMIHLSVCTNETDPKAITRWADMTHPTGLNHGWAMSQDHNFADGRANPCVCEQDQTRKHYLLVC